jgi:MerR family transcriptional regulator, redox-sensitive transcriptional activator SoxR
MPKLTISEVAQQVGLQASAIRYYKQIGLLPPAQRMSGQRRYDTTALYRLAIIQWARRLGFTLDEIVNCSSVSAMSLAPRNAGKRCHGKNSQN